MSSAAVSSLSSMSERGTPSPGTQPTLNPPEVVEVGVNYIAVLCWESSQHPQTASTYDWSTNSNPGRLEYRKVSSPQEALARTSGWTKIPVDAPGRVKIPGLEPACVYEIRLRCDVGLADPARSSTDSTDAHSREPVPHQSHSCLIQTLHAVPAEPHPPALISCTPSSLYLCWASPTASANDPSLSFRLMCQVSDAMPTTTELGQWILVHEGPETELLIPGLCPAGQYNFKLQVMNASGVGPWSSVVQHVTMAGAPGPPGDLRVVAMTATSVTAAWDVSAEHGRAVERYVLEFMLQGGQHWTLAMTDLQTSCEVTGLVPGQLYVFRVRAENSNGIGPWAQPLVVKVHDRPLPPPDNVTVVDWTRTAATIHWHAVHSLVPDVRYEAQLCAITTFAQAQWRAALREGESAHDAVARARGWCTVYCAASVGCRVDKLQPGCQYCFRVRTVTETLGAGRWSQTAKIITKPGVPVAPAHLHCQEATQTSLLLSWPAPPHTGGLRIVAYEISLARPFSAGQGAPGGTAADAAADDALYEWQCLTKSLSRPASSASSFSYTVGSLWPGRRFFARVRARNAEGESPWTPFCEFRTLADVPTTPGSGSADETTIDALTIPAQPSGEPEWKSHSLDARGKPALQELTLTKLQPGAVYAVRVAAENSVGSSQFSAAAELTTLAKAAAPPPPPPEVQEVSASAAILSWAPRAGERAGTPGDMCAHDEVERDETPRRMEVDVAKVAHDAAGSSRVGVEQPATLAWQRVYCGCERACLVSGLLPGSLYAFRLREALQQRVVDDAGAGVAGSAVAAAEWHAAEDESLWSACTVVTTLLAAPPPPVALSASARAPTSVRLAWQAQPRAGCAAAERFRLQIAAGDGDFEAVAESKSTTHHLRGLQPNTAYRIRVAAETACGHPGTWSDTIAVSTPPLPPPAPCAVTADLLPGSFRKGRPTCTILVTWDGGARSASAQHNTCAPAVCFEVEALEEGSRVVRARHTTSKPVASTSLQGLHPGVVYYVRVRAVAAGATEVSNWSSAVRVATPAASPLLLPALGPSSTPRSMSTDLSAMDSRFSLEVLSQSSEGGDGTGTPRCGGSVAAGGATVAAGAALVRKATPPAGGVRKRAGVGTAAPMARAPPRRRDKALASSIRRSPVLTTLTALALAGLLVYVIVRMS